MASGKMIQSESFRLTDLESHVDIIRSLQVNNPDYALSQDDLIDQGMTDERVYEYEYPAPQAAVSYDASSGSCFVSVNDQVIGSIRSSNVSHMRNILQSYPVTGYDLAIKGGEYRILKETENGYQSEAATAPFNASITVYYEKNAQAPSAVNTTAADSSPKRDEEPSSESSGWIDTSYATIEQQENPSRRGSFLLILSMILITLYLSFSIPYWITNRQNMTPLWDLIGQDVDNNILLLHGALLAVGFLTNLTAIFAGTSKWCILSAVCYTASVLLMPQYVIYVGISALCSAIASLRRSSGNGFIKFIFFAAVLGGIGFCGWQYYTGETILHIPEKYLWSASHEDHTDDNDYGDESEWDDALMEDETYWDDAIWEDESDWDEIYWEDESDIDMFEDDMFVEDWEDESEWDEELWEDESDWDEEFWEDESDWDEESDEDDADFDEHSAGQSAGSFSYKTGALPRL